MYLSKIFGRGNNIYLVANYTKIYLNNFHTIIFTYKSIGERFLWEKFKKIPLSLKYCSSSAIFSSYDEIEEISDINNIESQNLPTLLLPVLYENSTDSLIREISSCSSPRDVLDLFNKNVNIYQVSHVIQSIVVLWYTNLLNRKGITSDELNNFINRLLEKCNLYLETMNSEEAIFCFQYLNKLGVDFENIIMKNLFQKCNYIIKTENISLRAISRFVVTISVTSDLYKILTCRWVMPYVVQCLTKCENENDFRLITTILTHLNHIVTDNILEVYKKKVSYLLENDILNNSTTKSLIKAANFLNFPHWSQRNTNEIRSLLLLLEGNTKNLQEKELILVANVFQSHLEPIALVPLLNEKAGNCFKSSPCPEMLSCMCVFADSNQREKVMKLTAQILASHLERIKLDEFVHLYKALRFTKICDSKLCDVFWQNLLNEISANQLDYEAYKIFRWCHRYMYFNNNLGGTYRYIPFEKTMSEFILDEISNKFSRIIPSRFAKFTSFLIAYGHASNQKEILPDFTLEKLNELSERLDIYTLFQLSRGLQIALEMRFRKFMPKEAAIQFVKLNNILDKCTERILKKNLSSIDVNLLVRSMNNRKVSRNNELFKMVMAQYLVMEPIINSRIIRDEMYNIKISNYLIPNLIEDAFNYIVLHHDTITGDTVEKVLYTAFYLGYLTDSDEAIYWSAEIIKRDFDYMNGLGVVNSCLALCFYKKLPKTLISRVFSIEFIQKLEEEIRTCYSKATYPGKVLNTVMKLNRAVCLDYPEENVPWFQQNYINAQMAKKLFHQTNFYLDIRNSLLNILKNKELLRCNHVTPYGYKIDFVIGFNRNKQPLPLLFGTEDSEIVNRFAILLLTKDSFCENIPHTLKGHDHLRRRHLEILGYNVVYIDGNIWNSMYMSLPDAKVLFLKNLLQID